MTGKGWDGALTEIALAACGAGGRDARLRRFDARVVGVVDDDPGAAEGRDVEGVGDGDGVCWFLFFLGGVLLVRLWFFLGVF